LKATHLIRTIRKKWPLVPQVARGARLKVRVLEPLRPWHFAGKAPLRPGVPRPGAGPRESRAPPRLQLPGATAGAEALHGPLRVRALAVQRVEQLLGDLRRQRLPAEDCALRRREQQDRARGHVPRGHEDREAELRQQVLPQVGLRPVERRKLLTKPYLVPCALPLPYVRPFSAR
jgi:hypothetical protein